MADTISNAINYIFSTSSPPITNPPPPIMFDIQASVIANPSPPTGAPMHAVASTSSKFRHPSTIQDNDTPVIELDNCDELSDDIMGNYMQSFDNNSLGKGIFQNCTLNNPVFNITIHK